MWKNPKTHSLSGMVCGTAMVLGTLLPGHASAGVGTRFIPGFFRALLVISVIFLANAHVADL